jgi:hypothetical protein
MGFTFFSKQFGVKVEIHCAEINTCAMTDRPTDTLTAGSGATEHARQLSVTKNRASVKTLVERWFLDVRIQTSSLWRGNCGLIL